MIFDSSRLISNSSFPLSLIKICAVHLISTLTWEEETFVM